MTDRKLFQHPVNRAATNAMKKLKLAGWGRPDRIPAWSLLLGALVDEKLPEPRPGYHQWLLEEFLLGHPRSLEEQQRRLVNGLELSSPLKPLELVEWLRENLHARLVNEGLEPPRRLVG